MSSSWLWDTEINRDGVLPSWHWHLREKQQAQALAWLAINSFPCLPWRLGRTNKGWTWVLISAPCLAVRLRESYSPLWACTLIYKSGACNPSSQCYCGAKMKQSGRASPTVPGTRSGCFTSIGPFPFLSLRSQFSHLYKWPIQARWSACKSPSHSCNSFWFKKNPKR